MSRLWDWIETEWMLAAMGDRWRQIVWAPVLIPLSIAANLIDWLWPSEEGRG